MFLRSSSGRLSVLLLGLCSAATPLLGACGASDSGGTSSIDGGGSGGDATAQTDARPQADGTAAEASTAEAGSGATVDGNAGDVASPESGLPETGAADSGAADASAPDAGDAEAAAAEAGVDSGAPDAATPLGGDVLTQHNDGARTGATLVETKLTVANVSTATFGMLFARTVDDQTYAQPLVRLQVPVGDAGIHDVLYVATMNDTVYAFDADDPAQSTPLWKTSLADAASGVVPVTHTDVEAPCAPLPNISGNIGIESTPVIDPATNRMFVVAKTKDASGAQSYTLHALDLGTGLDQVPPVVIQATAPGSGAGSTGGTVAFDAASENQRASLLLANGEVYVGFGGYCDAGAYHGWLVAYDATTLAQAAVFNSTPDGSGGGTWMSGQGPAVDASGNVYALASGGITDVSSGGTDYGETLLELTPALTLVDWFTPYDYATYNTSGNFYGSAGVLLVPGTTLALSGSETSMLYVNDTTALGHWNASSDQIVQSLQLGGSEIHGAPVTMGGMVYVWAAGDTLRKYQLVGGQLSLVQSGPSPLSTGLPGGFLSLSANGSTAGTGILWVSQPLSGDASNTTVPGSLQAYDASNVATELWDSHEAAGDDCGAFAKFAAPTVANGKVYLPSFANQVCVYGNK